MKSNYLILLLSLLTPFGINAQDEPRPTACLKQEQLEKRIETVRKNKAVFEREVVSKETDSAKKMRWIVKLSEFDVLIQKTEEELILAKNDCLIASQKK